MKWITLSVDYPDEHGKIVLKDSIGNTFTSFSEELSDFISNTVTESPASPVDGREDEIKRLEQIIELKEKERKEWADMCIKKEKQLEELTAGYCTIDEYLYQEYGKSILKSISETFLKNATKADRLSDTEVFQALGETILNFPLPSPPKA